MEREREILRERERARTDEILDTRTQCESRRLDTGRKKRKSMKDGQKRVDRERHGKERRRKAGSEESGRASLEISR